MKTFLQAQMVDSIDRVANAKMFEIESDKQRLHAAQNEIRREKL